MRTVLIADDDYLVRMFLKQMVDWSSFGFTIAGDAKNGADALKLAQEIHPDLMITDVCMPVMDGIDLVRALQEEKLAKHILVLSNHDDFDYVRTAMKLGIDDYLLKNDLSPENLTKFLQKFSNEDSHDVTNTIEGKKSASLVSTTSKATTTTFASGSALLIQLRGFAARKQTWSNDELQTFLTSFHNALLNLCAHQRANWSQLELKPFQPTKGEDTWILLITFPQENSRAKVTQITQQFASALPNFLQRYFALTASVCILKAQSTQADLQSHWQRAYTNRFSAFYTEQDILTEDELFAEQTQSFPRIQQFALQELPSAITQADEIWQDTLKNFFSLLKESYLSYEHLEQLATLLEQQWQKNWQELLSSFTNFAEFQQKLTEVFAEIRSHARISHPAIRQAVDFIEAHSAENITEQQVAELVYLNPAYFSTLFKKHMGMGFSEYLNKTRLTRVQKRLRTSSERIKDIAQSEGFADYQYFCKLFKRTLGISPSTYRLQSLS